jgi:short-subunit dehydrogenase
VCLVCAWPPLASRHRDQTDAGEAEVRALNGTHCYMLVRGLLPGMMARGEGAVIGISSIMSKCGGLAGGCGC